MATSEYPSEVDDKCGEYKSMLPPFMLSNQKIVLTYKGLYDKKILYTILIQKISKCKNKNILHSIHIAHENNNNNFYTHALMLFNCPFRTSNVNYFDLDGTKSNLPIIRTLGLAFGPWNELCAAFMVCDPACAYMKNYFNVDPFRNVNLDPNKITHGKDKIETQLNVIPPDTSDTAENFMAKRPGQNAAVNSILMVPQVLTNPITTNNSGNLSSNSQNSATGSSSSSMNITPEHKETIIPIAGYRWQHDLIDELSQSASKKVIWYVPDPDNENSYNLMKEIGLHLTSLKTASDFLVLTALKDELTLFNLICKAISDQTWKGKTILIYLTIGSLKQYEQEKLTEWLTNSLVIIKDRIISKTDYGPRTIILNETPHIVVFSNFQPYAFAEGTTNSIELRMVSNNYKYTVVNNIEMIQKYNLIPTHEEKMTLLKLRQGKLRLTES